MPLPSELYSYQKGYEVFLQHRYLHSQQSHSKILHGLLEPNRNQSQELHYFRSSLSQS